MKSIVDTFSLEKTKQIDGKLKENYIHIYRYTERKRGKEKKKSKIIYKIRMQMHTYQKSCQLAAKITEVHLINFEISPQTILRK